MRISYISGPGDVVGTYEYWRRGEHDPRVPVLSYSGMFFDLVRSIEADAQVVTPWPAPDQLLSLEQKVTFSTVKRRQWKGPIGWRLSELEYATQCLKAVRSYAPDLVITGIDTQAWLWNALGGEGRKLIFTIHNSFWPMGTAPEPSKLERLRRKTALARGAVCTSHECERQFLQIVRRPLPTAVETPQIAAKYDSRVAASAARRLLFLGRIEENKGVFLLLDAFLSLGLEGLTLEFAGTGSAVEELTRRIDVSGNGNVRYLGVLDSGSVHEAISRTDLLVCPTMTTFNEGLAVVCFEAAAHGVPSLVSSVVPAQTMMGDGCRIFEADSLQALRSGLTALATNVEAYQKLCRGANEIKPNLYRRDLSWGSHLRQLMARI